jgi:hypothetical protein
MIDSLIIGTALVLAGTLGLTGLIVSIIPSVVRQQREMRHIWGRMFSALLWILCVGMAFLFALVEAAGLTFLWMGI